MKSIIFFIFTATLTSASISNGGIKVLDFTEQTVNLQWYNNNCRRCVVVVHDKTLMKSMHDSEIKVSLGLMTRRVYGLLPGHKYIIELVCFTMKGNFNRLLSEEFTTEKPSGLPNNPQGPFIVSNVTETTATLQWSKPKNSPSAVTYAIKLYKLFPGEIYPVVHFIDADKSPVYVYKGLTPKKAYQFEITAKNTFGFSEPLMSELFFTKSLNTNDSIGRNNNEKK